MKQMYVVALSVFLIGLALLTYSTQSGDVANIFGLIVYSQTLRGLGVIMMIFSVITFLAAFGGMNTLPHEKSREDSSPSPSREVRR
jgi:hypothetical protein